MKITRDIVKDLLTVYLAGEASKDTRVVVEAWLKSDPELASQVDRAQTTKLPVVEAPPTLAKRALDRTRRYMRRRMILLGAAVYVSTLPLSVTFNRHGFSGLLLDDWWGRGLALAVAATLWAIYFSTSRRLSKFGL